MTDSQSQLTALQVLENARLGGQRFLEELVENGVLIDFQEFARRRRWVSRGLHSVRSDGRIFSVQVRSRPYFVAMLAELPEPYMFDLVCALQGLEQGCQLLFLLRSHGALGSTAFTAYQRGAGERVLELARTWAAGEGDMRRAVDV